MKLRNKKTGEIVEAHEIDLIDKYVYLKIFRVGDYDTKQYNSLAELNEEWEDYEEPKEKYHWFISGRGTIEYEKDADGYFDRGHKSLGNYFETKEEAEKAVERLKAWKRLKEKIIDHVLKYEFDESTEDIHANISFSVESYPSVGNDLDLLFSGEDD